MKKLMIVLMMVVATSTASFAKGGDNHVQTAVNEVAQEVNDVPSNTNSLYIKNNSVYRYSNSGNFDCSSYSKGHRPFGFLPLAWKEE